MKSSMLPGAEVDSTLEDEFDELIIEFAEPLPVRVSEGLHQAIVLSVREKELNRWKRSCLVFKFKMQELGPAHGIILPGFVNLGTNHRQQKTKPSPASKLSRWFRIVADYTGGQRKRVFLPEFKRFLFRVIVTNVRSDNREQKIPDAAQGQIVAEIDSIVQQLGTGQLATTATTGWPKFINGLGPMRADGVDRCEQCTELTPFSYGCRRFCYTHAQLQAGGAD